MRRPLLIGNWKMHGSQKSMHQWVQTLAAHWPQDLKIDVVWAIPAPYLSHAKALTADLPGCFLAAQSLSSHTSGPYTGEISAEMMAEMGATYTLVGHAERRRFHHEGLIEIAGQIKEAHHAKLQPIVCLGEREQIHFPTKSLTPMAKEMKDLHAAVGEEIFQDLIWAYEPQWAIGQKAAEPHYLTQVFNSIEEDLTQGEDAMPLKKWPPLYGGSVTSATMPTLMTAVRGGFLVGQASLQGESFLALLQTMQCFMERSR